MDLMKREFFKISFLLLIFTVPFSGCSSEKPSQYDIVWPQLEEDQWELKMELVGQGEFPAIRGLDENSGVARVSHLNRISKEVGTDEDILVCHNDSFRLNSLYLFRMPLGGVDPPTVEKKVCLSIFNFDWEDVASLGTGRFLLADTGDNLCFRRLKTLYLIDLRPVYSGRRTPAVMLLTVAHPHLGVKGAFDCEAFFVCRGVVYYLTKDYGCSFLHSISLPDEAGEFAFNEEKKNKNWSTVPKTIYAKNCGSISLPDKMRITGADYCESQKLLAVQTYTKVLLYRDLNDESSPRLDILKLKPAGEYRLPFQRKFEAVSFLSDGRVLVLGELGDYFLLSVSNNG